MSNTVQIEIFSQERYDGQWPPENAIEFMEWLAAKVSSIPEEHRATATIEIDSVGSWDESHYPSLTISYTRPETDEEIKEREHREVARYVKQRAKELDILAQLKAKYEK